MIDPYLVKKYSKNIPRYTSFPTVLDWKSNLLEEQWIESIKPYCKEGEISIYIHIPFCQNICSFCACNKLLLQDYNAIPEYIDGLEREIQYYNNRLSIDKLLVSQLHFGGGTPTTINPTDFSALLKMLSKYFNYTAECEKSIEIHPSVVTNEHIDIFADNGFNRISIGVQDFNPEIQKKINRIQTYDAIESITKYSRSKKINNINYDYIYGLPSQDESCIDGIIEGTKDLKPNRIAFYSYAHVPWVSKGQTKLETLNIPSQSEKMNLLLRGIKGFQNLNYRQIGMDHFSLDGDELLTSVKSNKLYRNFMGYTTRKSEVMIGLGVSAISESPTAYKQNSKNLKSWLANSSEIIKSHNLTTEEQGTKNTIIKLMTQMQCKIKIQDIANQEDFQEMLNDNLYTYENDTLSVTELGRAFLRNIAHLLDNTVRNKSGFSSSI